jgi:hypothetical protein
VNGRLYRKVKLVREMLRRRERSEDKRDDILKGRGVI